MKENTIFYTAKQGTRVFFSSKKQYSVKRLNEILKKYTLKYCAFGKGWVI